jgi:hypothetical protein
MKQPIKPLNPRKPKEFVPTNGYRERPSDTWRLLMSVPYEKKAVTPKDDK